MYINIRSRTIPNTHPHEAEANSRDFNAISAKLAFEARNWTRHIELRKGHRASGPVVLIDQSVSKSKNTKSSIYSKCSILKLSNSVSSPG